MGKLESVEPFLKVLFIIVLLVSFMALFGVENLKKYLEDGSLITVSYEKIAATEGGEIESPAVTICPFNAETADGWKTVGTTPPYYEGFCAKSSREGTLEECILQNTFSLEESVPKLRKFGGWEVNSSDYFDSDITYASVGQCHSFKWNISIGTLARSQEAGGFLALGLNRAVKSIKSNRAMPRTFVY